MDIVIIANFCGNFGKKDNGRFAYLAQMLAEKHDVEVITSDFNHGAKKHQKMAPEGLSYRVTELHETGYPTNVCLKRFASHFVWGRNVEKYLAQRKKPDAIYCAAPSLTAMVVAAKYCKKNGIRFVIDIQDLWPEAFQMVFHVPVLSSLIFAPFRWMANYAYRSADAVVAVSQTYVKRALSVNKKCAAGTCVFLGTRLEDFDAHVAANPVTDKPEGELWLGYCGTLGSSYDLTTAFDALELLRDQGHGLPKFIVMGDGPRKAEFEKYAQDKKLDVLFTGRLPYDAMCGRLCACDMVVNPITAGAAQSIINKHADYAASGLPVLSTQECPEYRELVDAYRMGFNCNNTDFRDLAEKMLILIQNEELRREMGRNARRCAEERFDRKHSYQALVDIIEKTF